MSTIHFKNSQWIVTDLGIEPRPGIPYAEILARTLLEIRDDTRSQLYDWPLHIEEKSWADLPVFVEAWLFAIKHFHSGSIDWEKVALTISTAMKRRIRDLEDDLGEAAARIPRYYEPSSRVLNGSDLDLTHKAGKRWREFRYSVARELEQSQGEDRSQ